MTRRPPNYAGGWRAVFDGECARCGDPIVARETFIVMRKGRAICVGCASGGDDE